MELKELINLLCEYNKKVKPFEDGNGNIWTEPYLASQMLVSHLQENVDGASRKKETIENTVEYLCKLFLPSCSVLDLGCGPGLYSEKLARKGYKVTGVDFSENSIKYAIEHALENHLNIRYYQNDFLNLDYHDEFDVVMQIYGEINTFSDDNRNKLFKIVYNALKKKGMFIFDVTTPNRRKNDVKATSWYTSDGGFFSPKKHIVLENIIPYDSNIWLESYIVVDENGTKIYRNWFHEYTKETITKVLLDIGFSKVEVSDKLYGENQNEVDWLTVIAYK